MSIHDLINRVENKVITVSEEVQLDNLDWARLIYYKGMIQVENEHGTMFEISELSDKEIDIFIENLKIHE